MNINFSLRQRMTIIHLKTINGIETTGDILDWLDKKILQPRYGKEYRHGNTRRRNVLYYKQLKEKILMNIANYSLTKYKKAYQWLADYDKGKRRPVSKKITKYFGK